MLYNLIHFVCFRAWWANCITGPKLAAGPHPGPDARACGGNRSLQLRSAQNLSQAQMSYNLNSLNRGLYRGLYGENNIGAIKGP